MKVFKTWSNSKPTEGKSFDMPSMTVPDQTMSMRTILERYAKGLPVTDGKEPIFDENPELSLGINPRTLDLVDLQVMEMENKESIKNLKEKRKKQYEHAQNLQADGEEASTNLP